MSKLRIGKYIYIRISKYSDEWVICGEVKMGADGEYIEWFK